MDKKYIHRVMLTVSLVVSVIFLNKDTAFAKGTMANSATKIAAVNAVDQTVFKGYSKVCDITPLKDKVTFSTVDYNGNKVDSSILSQYDLTLINIWEPWCGPCANEMPDLEKVYEYCQKKGIRFNIIGFNSDQSGRAKVLSNAGVTYTTLKYVSSLDKYQTGSIPLNFFVNSQGYILPIKSEELAAAYVTFFKEIANEIKNGNPEGYDTSNAEVKALLEADRKGTLNKFALQYVQGDVGKYGQTYGLDEETLIQLIVDRIY